MNLRTLIMDADKRHVFQTITQCGQLFSNLVNELEEAVIDLPTSYFDDDYWIQSFQTIILTKNKQKKKKKSNKFKQQFVSNNFKSLHHGLTRIEANLPATNDEYRSNQPVKLLPNKRQFYWRQRA